MNTKKVILSAAARKDISSSLRHLAATIEAEAMRQGMQGSAARQISTRVQGLRAQALAFETAEVVSMEGRI